MGDRDGFERAYWNDVLQRNTSDTGDLPPKRALPLSVDRPTTQTPTAAETPSSVVTSTTHQTRTEIRGRQMNILRGLFDLGAGTEAHGRLLHQASAKP
jgi:hypothetical protein